MVLQDFLSGLTRECCSGFYRKIEKGAERETDCDLIDPRTESRMKLKESQFVI